MYSASLSKRILNGLLIFWTVTMRRTRDKVALLCFLQAVTVLTSGLFVLYYMPELILEEDETIDHGEEMEIVEKHQKELIHYQDILKERKMLSKGIMTQMRNGLTCVVFRFDTLPEHGGADQEEAMINDEEEYAYFSKENDYKIQNIPDWFKIKVDLCDGCFALYGPAKYVVLLKDVTIYPKFARGKKGGEELEDVFLQSEADEKITLEKGYFVLNSNELDLTGITVGPHLQKFVDGLLVVRETDVDALQAHRRQDVTAVIVTRREYANIYHITMDWYDVFLIMVLFKIDPYHLEVIWLDAHPKSTFDNAWEILYGVPIRAGSLTDPVKYSSMVWNGFGHKSHINQHQVEYLPYVNEFRHFVLSRFEIDDDHKINCKELRITIIWRRHYIAHPRNPSGYTARRIANEEEVWKAVKEADFRAVVNGVQLDRLSMVEQLELISRTDILIGMHGAGLSHILYLPKTSGVIELYPNYMSVANAHFRAMSKWRRLRHVVWANQNKDLELKDHQTVIPKAAIQDLVNVMKENVCGKMKDL